MGFESETLPGGPRTSPMKDKWLKSEYLLGISRVPTP